MGTVAALPEESNPIGHEGSQKSLLSHLATAVYRRTLGKCTLLCGWLARQAKIFVSCQVSFLLSVYLAAKPELSFPDKDTVIACSKLVGFQQ